MATLTISQLSEQALDRLRLEAERESLDPATVAARYLEEDLRERPEPQRRSTPELLALADAIRANEKAAALTPEFIRAAREYGRQ